MLKESKIKIVVLTSKIKQQEKKNILNEIEEGKAHIVIGTHAIFQENLWKNHKKTHLYSAAGAFCPNKYSKNDEN